MSKKLTHNKIHRGAPEPRVEKSQVVAAVEDLASSTKSKVKSNRTPLIVLLVLVLLAVLAFQLFQEIKAGQQDQLQGTLYLLTSSPPAVGQEDSRVRAMGELLQAVKGQPQERSFYLKIVATLLEQADPAVAASANPFSITPITAGSNDDGDTGRKKLLVAAGQLAGEANKKFGSTMIRAGSASLDPIDCWYPKRRLPPNKTDARQIGEIAGPLGQPVGFPLREMP